MAEPNEQTITAWMSENDAHTSATLLKMIEEAGELISRTARSLMAGQDAADPDSGRSNREEMEREMADMYATMEEAQSRLNYRVDHNRINGKRRGFAHWHNLIDEELAKKLNKND